MKVISFFSAKGGTGKTTFNVLLASYIKYRLGKRVMVLDFDFPEFNLAHMRERDLLYLEREGIPFKEEDFYPIERVRKKKAKDICALAGQLDGGDVSNFSNNMTIPYSTTDGWVAMGARVLNLTSKFSDITTLRPVLGARTSVNGTLTSPVLSGGCGKVTIDYARITTKTGSNFTIDIKSSDGSTVLKSENHVDETMTQYGREQLDFDINVTGDFIIVVTGNKCSNTGTSNDDFAILGLSWTGYSE